MGGKHANPCPREWYWQTGDYFLVWKSLDWPAIRRGRQVYTEVFAPCHSLKGLTFNHLQQLMTREEIKALAASYDITELDMPAPDGSYPIRKGKPADGLPAPYPNQQAAQFANNGAEPPDLRSIVYGRHGGCDYIFSLMTGYHWQETLGYPPWLGEMKPHQFFNPYFKGMVISMPPPLSDGMVDYQDGTPATVSQMSKDVAAFLMFTCEPEYDERRIYFWKSYITGVLLCVLLHHQSQKYFSWRHYQRTTFRYWGNKMGI